VEAIRCEGLTKHYDTVAALEGLDLAVDERSVFGFLGPNGAGKTTTLKLLLGLSLPTAGRAWVAGEPVAPQAVALRSRIGYLPEVPAFYNWMTGRELLSFVADLHGLPVRESRSRAEELLETAGLKAAAGRKIGGYSRGMRQRLGIAQALVNRPRVLFLDEPVSALDPIGRSEVLSLILRLKEKTTIFMSTHILTDVERVCDVVGIINQGRLVARSSIEELREGYGRSLFELEFEEDAAPLVPRLKAASWLDRLEEITANGVPILRLAASDIDTAKKELPRLVADSGLTLRRYELTPPSLEDIFIALVGGGR
jgi:ABC-2 type transport system ATP-binding protein